MIKNKKILSVLSTTAIAGLMVAAVNSTVFADASAIAVTGNDGKIYEYQYDALKASALSKITNGSTDPGAKLYNDFLQRKTGIRAFYDNTRKSYVEFDTISKEATSAVAKGVSFSLNSFIKSTSTPTTTITTTPVSLDANGNVVINGQTVATTAVDMSTVKCSNPIEPFSTLVSFKLSVSDPQNYTVTVKGKAATLNASTGIFSAYVDGKFAVSDIKASDFASKKNTVSSDKPTIKSVTMIDSSTIRVRFSKDADFAYATNKQNYKLLDSNSIDISSHIRGIYSTVGESDTNNTDTYNIKLYKFNPYNGNEDWRLTGSPYTLTIKNVIDTEATPNTMDDYTCVLNGNDTAAPTVTGIYAKLRSVSGTGKDSVIVSFNEAMDADTISNRDNYKFVNGEGDTKVLPSDAIISVGGDNKSAIIEFPSIYNVKTNITTISGSATDITYLVVYNVKDVAGNFLGGVVYSSTISTPATGTTVKDNSIKAYYDGDDLKVDVQLTNPLDSVCKSDFTLGGVEPSSVLVNGDKVTLIFKDSAAATTSEILAHPITYANGKTNSNSTKIDVIKAQGENAKLSIVSTSTVDALGAKICRNSDGTPVTLSIAQSTIYDYQAGPRTSPDCWSGTKDINGGKVYVTFDTPLDVNSGIKSDDFVFTGENATDIKADSVTISGNTLIFTFSNTNKDYAAFTDTIDIRAKNTVSLRSTKDLNGGYYNYTPSSDDLKKRSIRISR